MPYGDGTGPWRGCRRPRRMSRDDELKMLEQEKQAIDDQIARLKNENTNTIA